MVVAALAAIFIVAFLFALPMIGEMLGTELVPGILNTWLLPLIVLALTWVVAVLSLIAWRRGDRSVVGQVILILSLAGATLLALDAVLEAIAGRRPATKVPRAAMGPGRSLDPTGSRPADG